MTAAGLGYSLYKPVNEAADFEQAMARVNAVAFSGGGRDKAADAEAFKALQEQARQLGRDTQFSAVQAAQSQENLARAGFKANEIIAAMPGLLNMAAAEGMDLATAADIAANTLRGFKMSADQMVRVSDVLAQTSAASNSSIAGLGESMKMVAPVAANLGVSVEEVSAMLGMMANAGIKGTESGSALRNAFLRLAQEPVSVEKALAQLGIASRDAQGNMRKLPDIMQALSEKMKNMGEADKTKYMADIFGVRAVSGMMAVMSGAVNGELEQLYRLNKGATGELQAIADSVGLTVNDMWAGMKGSETFAEKLGVSFRDLSIYTAMLAKSGIKGSADNDVLTATFSRLAKDTNKVKEALKGYDISLFKDNGEMRDFPDILNDINNAIKDMDEGKQIEAITKIFGAEAMPGAQALLAQLGAGAYTEVDTKAKKAKGVSAEMAEKLIETFNGQLQIASSAIEGFKFIGKGAFDVGKLVAYKVQTLAVAGATKLWAAAQKLWFFAMKAGGKLLDVGKLVLYYGKQLLIATATKAWTAAQWLWNAAMTANPLGAIIVAIGLAIAAGYALYKNWDTLKKWWNSWTIKDVFAAIGKYIDGWIDYVKDKWQKFTDWIADLNPFKDWTPPTVDAETAKAMKAETLQKYGTLNLRLSYVKGYNDVQVRNVS